MRLLILAAALTGLSGMVLSESLEGNNRVSPHEPRSTLPLNGDWLFQRDRASSNEWKTVRVSSNFEEHEGNDFDGAGWYRRSIPPFTLPQGQRCLLHFQAAATLAEVWWNGVRLGSHLGGWTPFRFDVTPLVSGESNSGPHEIRVRVDEKVGHNMQGFLPVVEPHFGGLWQSVELRQVPSLYFDELKLQVVTEPNQGLVKIRVPLKGEGMDAVVALNLRYRLKGSAPWIFNKLPRLASPSGSTSESDAVRIADGLLEAWFHIPQPRWWSPNSPNLYEIEMELSFSEGATKAGDRIAARAAFRNFDVYGSQFRLNGEAVSLRGILNWGYYPPHLSPALAESQIRQDLAWARSLGFNLMKFCLWVPPRRFLEIADEVGMLTWMEYPTWHPTLDQKHRNELLEEFTEFFEYDRNHPSVVLRSLTCETGAGADLEVINQLYNRAHQLIPGAVVEDDSSWIEWNRVHDFYDDHPYGNNHTWTPTLRRLNEYILGHGLKPLALGEAIAADTWVDARDWRRVQGENPPYWWPAAVEDQTSWMERIRQVAGPISHEQLTDDSLRYAWLMRKYQVEAYRREVPYGGYVVSVIRDIPLASMGMMDYRGQSKWSPGQWEWQRDTVCLLETKNDARSFTAGGKLEGKLFVSHFGSTNWEGARLTVSLLRRGTPETILAAKDYPGLVLRNGTLLKAADLDFPLPSSPVPETLAIRASLQTPGGVFQNEWPLWVVPAPSLAKVVKVHSSIALEGLKDIYPQATAWEPGQAAEVVVAARFDDDLVAFVESGGCALLLPDGKKRSLPLSAHWFLRGAPVLPQHPLVQAVPRNFWIDLQHFDLASDVIPNPAWLETVDPILLLWDTHDSKVVKTHALAFEARTGKGKILVSALRHDGLENAAGKWLFTQFIEHLVSGPPPRQSLPDAMWKHLKQKLHAESVPLLEKTWKFHPDPNNQGMEKGWHQTTFPDRDWADIHIGAAWEAQGYPALDGWAWYRLKVPIPGNWQTRDIYLSFEGVDDLYELYINGELVAKRGDLATRKDTFNERLSHRITSFVKPGESCLIAVRVHDWYGAGGIFRPVTLGTVPIAPELDFIK